jgi:hypothetical protein
MLQFALTVVYERCLCEMSPRGRPTYLIYTFICLNKIFDTRERNKRGNIYVYGLANQWTLGEKGNFTK